MTTSFAITQKVLLAAADVLWAAQIIKPDAEPTAVMMACANMLRAIQRVQPQNQRQANDIDPALVRKIIRAK